MSTHVTIYSVADGSGVSFFYTISKVNWLEADDGFLKASPRAKVYTRIAVSKILPLHRIRTCMRGNIVDIDTRCKVDILMRDVSI